MMSGAMTPCSRAANSPPPPMWTWRPPRAMASTALTARAANVPTAMSVSMLVAPWRSEAGTGPQERPAPGELDHDGQAEHDPTGHASWGARIATPSATSAVGQEMAARSPQWSGSPAGADTVVTCAPRRRRSRRSAPSRTGPAVVASAGS